jgi:hypothetical protein
MPSQARPRADRGGGEVTRDHELRDALREIIDVANAEFAAPRGAAIPWSALNRVRMRATAALAAPLQASEERALRGVCHGPGPDTLWTRPIPVDDPELEIDSEPTDRATLDIIRGWQTPHCGTGGTLPVVPPPVREEGALPYRTDVVEIDGEPREVRMYGFGKPAPVEPESDAGDAADEYRIRYSVRNLRVSKADLSREDREEAARLIEDLAARLRAPDVGRAGDRLAALLGEVAQSGVEHDDPRDGYAVVQIDSDLWDEVQAFKPAPAEREGTAADVLFPGLAE